MSVFSSSEDIGTGVIEMNFTIKRAALEILCENIIVTEAMRELADFGDEAMREMVDVVAWLRDRARDDE